MSTECVLLTFKIPFLKQQKVDTGYFSHTHTIKFVYLEIILNVVGVKETLCFE